MRTQSPRLVFAVNKVYNSVGTQYRYMSIPKPKTEPPAEKKIEQILDLLQEEYGAPEWKPHNDPVSVLVRTILSQNTSDANSGAAFQSLTDCFSRWEDMIDADVDYIARCIRGGGLGKIKAQRIKQTLREIAQKRGQLELDFLRQMSPSAAQGWLEELKGVGPKTACCVLLFSLGIPALPVDTHILRVSKRLGLLGSRTSPQEAHRLLREIVPPESVYQFHISVIEHGRRICRARQTRCRDCALARLCQSYKASSTA